MIKIMQKGKKRYKTTSRRLPIIFDIGPTDEKSRSVVEECKKICKMSCYHLCKKHFIEQFTGVRCMYLVKVPECV